MIESIMIDILFVRFVGLFGINKSLLTLHTELKTFNLLNYA